MEAARARALLFILLVFAFLAAYFPVCDNDVWWHVRAGEIILDAGRIPREDPFSHLAEGHAWITHEWLTEVVMALVARAGGLPTLTLAKCATAAALALLLWRLARGAGAGPEAAFAAVALVLATARFRFFERPHLATFLLLPLVLEHLARSAADPLRPFRPRDVWLPALFALWANLHGGFLIGLVLFPIAMAVAALRGARAGPGAASPGALRLALLLGLCALATLANPNGFQAHLYPLINERALKVVRNGEWLPPSPRQFPLFFVLLGALALLALRFRRAAGAARLAPLLPLAALALRSNRSIGEFAIASAVPLALLLDAAGSAAWRAPAPAQAPSHPAARSASAARRAAPLAAAIALAGALVLLHARGDVIDTGFYRFGLGVNASRFPVKAADYVVSRNLQGRLANSPGFGGYLIWRLWPERKIFADGRLDVYVDVNEVLVRTPWKKTLAERGLTYAILETEGGLGPDPLALAVATSPDWALLHWDDVAMTWVKAVPEHEEAIRADRYRIASPLRDPSRIPADSIGLAIAEYERAAVEEHAFHALFALGVLRLRAGDAAAAEEALARAARLRLRDPPTWSNLALARLAAARPADALDAARRALRLAPRDAPALRHLGVALFDLGRFAEAEDAFLKVRALEPGNPEIEERIRECRRRRAR